jgi:exosortase
MSTVIETAPAPLERQLPDALKAYWPLIVGFLAAAIPTFVTLGQQSWSTEAGAHGPIVLATGIWLLFQSRRDILAGARPLALVWLLLALVPMVVAYAFGRALDLLVIESMALYAIFLIAAARFTGIKGIWRNLFPFAYLAFLIPPPGWVLDTLTGPLREGISFAATEFLNVMGYPVSREGVVIYIAQYQLLVEDACSGMNSLIGLSAISLFYIYILHRADWRHTGLLLAAVLPIAIVSNLVRVLVLILLTYYAGDAVAQGFLHNVAGIMLFAIALALVVLTDLLLRRILSPKAARVAVAA